MRYRRHNAGKSVLLLEVCVTLWAILNFHIFEQVQMIPRHPDRTRVLPSYRNYSLRAVCQIDIEMKSSLVAYPARAVGLAIRVGSREFVTLCVTRTGNCWGSASARATRLLSCLRWRFRQLGIAKLRGSMFAVRKYIFQYQLMLNSDCLLL